MASSKFWTWTKGSNVSRPSGEYGRESPNPNKRKPLPLDFGPGLDDKPNRKTSSRTNDSIALQEAAVQSATSLLAVMNDCLNTHLLTTQPNGLQPAHGRPRSRTCPSTPIMAEAPPMEPVELPASPSPTRKQTRHKVKHSVDSKLARNMSSTKSQYLGEQIYRPHSSPQEESSHKLPPQSRPSYESFYRCDTTYPPATLAPPTKFGSPLGRLIGSNQSAFNVSNDTLVSADNESGSNAVRRPSSAVSPKWQRRSTSTSAQGTPQPHGVLTVPRASMPAPHKASIPEDAFTSVDPADMLIAQVAAMRASHEAHIASLKETHEREMAFHKAYISLLENRKTVTAATPNPQSALQQERKHLTIDTSHPAQRVGGLASSDVSASTSLQSFEMSLENHKRASLEAAAEVEALKRKLELSRKAQADSGDVRKERDKLRETAEKNDRRILQLKDLVRKTKENERAAKNAAASLEAALESANIERIDVLEGFHEACTQVQKLRQRERGLKKERNELSNKCNNTEANSKRTRSSGSYTDARIEYEELERRRNTLRHDPLLQQLDELRQMVAEKAARIQELENNQERQPGFEDDTKVHLGFFKRQLSAAQMDRDRYNSLLHSELRRQSRIISQKPNAPTPQVEAEASIALSKRLRADSAVTSKGHEQPTQDAETEMSKIESLENELKHCMQEIILYKLDIKGYKKDVKKAIAEVEALKTRKTGPPSVPEKDTSFTPPQTRHEAGLGIVWPEDPGTPTRAAASPLPPPPSTLSSPPNRSKTPLSMHKKLPKPPSSSTSPSQHIATQQTPSPPTPGIQRQETLRSLSESIISSYAKRSTPEQQSQMNVFQTSPHQRTRSTEPLKASNAFDRAATVPISMPKYSPEMLRTPVRSAAAACFT